MPPIAELTRIEPIHLERLARQGIFTTGLLLEVSETPTRRQTLADQVDASTNDVLRWRDEALLLNLAGFGSAEHDLFAVAGFDGLGSVLRVDLETFSAAIARAVLVRSMMGSVSRWLMRRRKNALAPTSREIAASRMSVVRLRMLRLASRISARRRAAPCTCSPTILVGVISE